MSHIVRAHIVFAYWAWQDAAANRSTLTDCLLLFMEREISAVSRYISCHIPWAMNLTTFVEKKLSWFIYLLFELTAIISMNIQMCLIKIKITSLHARESIFVTPAGFSHPRPRVFCHIFVSAFFKPFLHIAQCLLFFLNMKLFFV